MNKLKGLKLALCQMPVNLGRPDLNTEYMAEETSRAARNGTHIIIFPELSVTGYIIGDLFEREEFIFDANKLCDATLRQSTAEGIAAIVGLPVYNRALKGEDGRLRLYNAAVIYQNGHYIGSAIKTLQPNYRMFDDDRHFFSKRKLAFEDSADLGQNPQVFPVTFDNRGILKIGLMLCEDMWRDDYSVNPSEILVKNGAEILINISASPWGWQKNRKRHSIVKNLLAECQVPLVYVNNTGLQNNGKNLIIFDGSSTVYDKSGEIIFEVPPYNKGTYTFTFGETKDANNSVRDDSAELYLAVHNAIKEFCRHFNKVVIGVSGGIDSAVAAAAFVDALGADKVLGIFMPYSKYSSVESRDRAETIAKNLGIEFRVVSINAIVGSIAATLGITESTLEFENIQARARMEILAAVAQKESGIFTCNTNKVEAAFGYGTMYADIAGALAVFADMVKREIYQLGDYLNTKVFGREVIPASCFTVPPTAALNVDQKDPFHYGNLTHRGYHDEMVRAFTEFRFGPEWFLDNYLKGTLEHELKLELGTLKALFPSTAKFIADLEKHWHLYHQAFFKTNQMPPILIVSKRAFGYDLRRSILSEHLTQRYNELKEYALNNFTPRIAVYGGSFNPPALHHLQTILAVLKQFDGVMIVPCGPRKDKNSVNLTAVEDRKNMSQIAFGKIRGVEIDWRDLERNKFTPTMELSEIYQKLMPKCEIWFVAGGDLMLKDAGGKSVIQSQWVQGEKIWAELNWVVIPRDNIILNPENLPPHSEVISTKGIYGSSSSIRQMVSDGKDVSQFVTDEIATYIKENDLYQKP